MTVEEKNKVLHLFKEKTGCREIARIVGRDPANISRFINRVIAEHISGFAECPNCGREIVHYKSQRGRRRVYCCKECQRSEVARKNTVFVCLECGKSYHGYQFQKRKYCSVSCYLKHRYGERL